MKYWLFSILTALIAYCAGCLKSTVLASNYIFHRNLRRLGSGNVLISNFRRIYGWKGVVKITLAELVLDLFPIVLGTLLFRVGDHAIVGSALAGLCLVLGRLYPMTYAFSGRHAIIPLILMGLFISPSIGALMLAAALAALWFSRYYSLTALVCELLLVITAVLMIDDPLTIRLSLMTGGLVLLFHIPSIPRMLRRTEPRLSFEQDISYKFDEKF